MRIVFECPFCPESFNTFQGLMRHVRRYHSNVCPICGKKFKNILTHVRQSVNWDENDDYVVLYGLLSNHTNGLSDDFKKFKAFCRDVAIRRTMKITISLMELQVADHPATYPIFKVNRKAKKEVVR